VLDSSHLPFKVYYVSYVCSGFSILMRAGSIASPFYNISSFYMKYFLRSIKKIFRNFSNFCKTNTNVRIPLKIRN